MHAVEFFVLSGVNSKFGSTTLVVRATAGGDVEIFSFSEYFRPLRITHLVTFPWMLR